MIDKFRKFLFFFLIGLPIASLVLNATSWLRFGIDLPLYDDWRGYISGEMHSLEFNYLFHPVNDTITPIGFALDALAQRYLDGNSVAYQFISMIVVLGGLLLLQWRFLRETLGDPQLAAACFSFTLLMTQPGSYWGQQNMAYHQALPLLFILFSLLLLIKKNSFSIWRMILIFILSLLAGFSYISGAFGVLAVGISLLLVRLFSGDFPLSKSLYRGGLLLTLSGIFSSFFQFSQAISGFDTHGSGTTIAFPTDIDFWLFFLGKIARSLALPQGVPMLSFLVAAAVFSIVLILCLSFASSKSYWHIASDKTYRVGVVFFSLTVLIFVYLVMIAAGRVNMKPPEATTKMHVFLYGFERFHFFWATLLWPWLVAALIVTWQALRRTASTTIEFLCTGGAALLACLMGVGGVFSHAAQYRAGALYRLPTLACLAEQLQRDKKIDCPEFFNPDLRGAYAYGRSVDASFVRHFPIFPIPMGVDEPPALYRLTRDNIATTMRNVGKPDKDGSQLAEIDAQIWLKISKDTAMAKCLLLEVNASIQTTQPDTAKLYYRTLGKKEFSEQESQQLTIKFNEVQHLSYQVSSPSGFADDLRFDPVSKVQRFKVLELEVRCRLSLPPREGIDK